MSCCHHLPKKRPSLKDIIDRLKEIDILQDKKIAKKEDKNKSQIKPKRKENLKKGDKSDKADKGNKTSQKTNKNALSFLGVIIPGSRPLPSSVSQSIS